MGTARGGEVVGRPWALRQQVGEPERRGDVQRLRHLVAVNGTAEIHGRLSMVGLRASRNVPQFAGVCIRRRSRFPRLRIEILACASVHECPPSERHFPCVRLRRCLRPRFG